MDDQKSGRGCLLLFLVTTLVISLTANLLLTVFSVVAVAGKSEPAEMSGYEALVLDGDAKDAKADIIAVVPIQGMIMNGFREQPTGMVYNTIRLLRALSDNPRVKAILLDIDSPGGGVTASDQIYHELLEFKQAHKLPIVALFGDVAASGGYYVAMASDHIVAHETSVTGSIGVISHFYDVSELMHKVGVSVNTVKSLNSQGQESFKDIGSPYRPMKPAERSLMQGLITVMWDRFTHVVADGRKGKLTLEEVQKLADGRVFTGGQALDQKLVDSVGYRQDAYRVARELARSPQAQVVLYKRSTGWQDYLSFGARATPPDLDSLLQRPLEQGPRLLYLWTGR